MADDVTAMRIKKSRSRRLGVAALVDSLETDVVVSVDVIIIIIMSCYYFIFFVSSSYDWASSYSRRVAGFSHCRLFNEKQDSLLIIIMIK